MRLLREFLQEEDGMETVEWAMLTALIIAGAISVIAGIGINATTTFTTIRDGIKP